MREHGTESRYSAAAYKCRCAECRAAHAKYHREVRARARQRAKATHKPTEVITRRRRDGLAEVMCWCESQMLLLPIETVAQCMTGPCDEEQCHAMHAESVRARGELTWAV